MKITNIHKRDYNLPSSILSEALASLSSEKDLLWPKEEWTPMILNNGLKKNSNGGHGPIEYFVQQYEYGKTVEFCFTKPEEFVGIHKFEIIEFSPEKTGLKHTIEMKVNLKGLLTWYIVVKWLHDALLEDCLDKVYNQHNDQKIKTPQNYWVKTLRKILKPKK